jgi:hypothetical protein
MNRLKNLTPESLIKIRISRNGKGGRPRDGDDARKPFHCRVSAETGAQMEAWLDDLQAIDPGMGLGKLMDLIVSLVQRRIGTVLVPANGGGFRLEKTKHKNQ